jgi:hypothetical protein
MKKILLLLLITTASYSQTLLKLKAIEYAPSAGYCVITNSLGVQTYTPCSSITSSVGLLPSTTSITINGSTQSLSVNPTFRITDLNSSDGLANFGVTNGGLGGGLFSDGLGKSNTINYSFEGELTDITDGANSLNVTKTANIYSVTAAGTSTINLTATNVLKNGVEIATTNQLPVLTASTGITVSGASPNYTISSTTNTIGLLTSANPAYTGSLSTGSLTYTDTGILSAFTSSVNGYNQIVLQNSSSNVGASTNFIISNDIGTATSNFGEFGMNSSTFTGTPVFSKAGDVYLTATSQDLVLGTTTSNSVLIAANSSSVAALTVSPTNSVTVTGTLSARGYSTTSGTSTQFLKANGTVDGSTYLTAATVPSSVVTTTGTQTLTNKTITSPTFSTAATFTYATASTVPIFNASRQLVSSTTTTTELTYLAGVTSAIQTQLNTKASLTGTETLTNKRMTPRTNTVTTTATITANSDAVDFVAVTTLSTATTFTVPTGTPTEGQGLIYRIKDNGTARALTFNAIFRFSSDMPAPTTTVLSKIMYLAFIYNLIDAKWDCVGLINNF